MKWIILLGALALLLAFDLWLARRESRGAGMSVRKATLHSIGWLAVALAFGAGMLVVLSGRDAGLYFAGFLVEKSLSLDNVFVFLLILTSFGIPRRSVTACSRGASSPRSCCAASSSRSARPPCITPAGCRSSSPPC